LFRFRRESVEGRCFAVQRVVSFVSAAPVARARSLVLFAAFVSFVISIVLWFGGHHDQAIFVGLWVPSILSLGAVVLPRSGR
jgi:hypothetical protein